MRLYDTLSGTVTELLPPGAETFGLYVCGPTPQGPPHFGHARAFLVPDALRRYLEWTGIRVLHVRNVTDIEDKVIARARETGEHPAALAERFGRVWEEQLLRLGVLPPHIVPRATGHVIEMIELIEDLIAAGSAYEHEGDVWFAVRSYDAYGALSGRKPDELRSGTRITPEEGKRDPLDFALWKSAKEGEPSWASPWGRGRPGWHIECSAMSTKYLGAGFDLHMGGSDLVFPHHENEIAQFEASGRGRFARHWAHNGMLTLADTKMSKSLGNVIGLADAIDRYGADTLRHFMLRADYRQPVEFSEALLEDAAAGVDRMRTFLRSSAEVAVDVPADVAAVAAHRAAFVEAMEDDLALPRAHAALFAVVAEGNRFLAAGAWAEAAGARAVLLELAGVLGYTLEAERVDTSGLVAGLVEDQLALREEARGRRDFATADVIRERLAARGVIVEDSPDGPRWHLARDAR